MHKPYRVCQINCCDISVTIYNVKECERKVNTAFMQQTTWNISSGLVAIEQTACRLHGTNNY